MVSKNVIVRPLSKKRFLGKIIIRIFNDRLNEPLEGLKNGEYVWSLAVRSKMIIGVSEKDISYSSLQYAESFRGAIQRKRDSTWALVVSLFPLYLAIYQMWLSRGMAFSLDASNVLNYLNYLYENHGAYELYLALDRIGSMSIPSALYLINFIDFMAHPSYSWFNADPIFMVLAVSSFLAALRFSATFIISYMNASLYFDRFAISIYQDRAKTAPDIKEEEYNDLTTLIALVRDDIRNSWPQSVAIGVERILRRLELGRKSEFRDEFQNLLDILKAAIENRVETTPNLEPLELPHTILDLGLLLGLEELIKPYIIRTEVSSHIDENIRSHLHNLTACVRDSIENIWVQPTIADANKILAKLESSGKDEWRSVFQDLRNMLNGQKWPAALLDLEMFIMDLYCPKKPLPH